MQCITLTGAKASFSTTDPKRMSLARAFVVALYEGDMHC